MTTPHTSVLAAFAAALASRRIEVIDLTQTLTPEFPQIALPPEMGQCRTQAGSKPTTRPVMNTMSVMPAATASSTAYWISGLSTMGIISFGLALVAGRKRVPRPATGNTALLTFFIVMFSSTP